MRYRISLSKWVGADVLEEDVVCVDANSVVVAEECLVFQAKDGHTVALFRSWNHVIEDPCCEGECEYGETVTVRVGPIGSGVTKTIRRPPLPETKCECES